MSKKSKNETKKDNSPVVPQRDKIRESLVLTQKFTLTDKQQSFFDTILDKKTNIVFCQGVAGTGKSYTSTYAALECLSQKKVSQIILTRNPVESCSTSLGYLKGTYLEKMEPHMSSSFARFDELISKGQINKLTTDERIKIVHLGFMRGESLNSTIILNEECQNLTVADFLLVMSRIGKFSKLVFCGDWNQCDIRKSGFKTIFNLFNNEESKQKGIHTFEFGPEDIVRNDFLSFIIHKFESLKDKNES